MWSAGHLRTVLLAWLIVAVGFGAFAPRARTQHPVAGHEPRLHPTIAGLERLLPVALRLAGHTARHRPRWLDRLLPHVHFSH